MDVKTYFAERLKELRIQRGINQEDFADIIGLSRGSISFYEKAQRTADIETIYKVAKFFNVSVEYLLGISPVEGTFLPVVTSEKSTVELKKLDYTQTELLEKIFLAPSFYRIIDSLSDYRKGFEGSVEQIIEEVLIDIEQRLRNDLSINMPQETKDTLTEKIRTPLEKVKLEEYRKTCLAAFSDVLDEVFISFDSDNKGAM